MFLVSFTYTNIPITLMEFLDLSSMLTSDYWCLCYRLSVPTISSQSNASNRGPRILNISNLHAVEETQHHHHRTAGREPTNTIEDHMLALVSTCQPEKLLIVGTFDHNINQPYPF